MAFTPPFMIVHILQPPFKAFPDPAPSYAAADRPDASTVPVGTEIFNLADNVPNWSDGTNWRDAQGNLT